MNDGEVNKVLDVARDTVREQVRDILSEVCPGDFTTSELIALVAVVRPVWERIQKPAAPVLELVRSAQSGKG